MPPSSLKRPAIGAAILFVLAILSWEIYLRKDGVNHSFDDGGPLWAHHRDRVYQPIKDATVFIGSSRIKFDLDIDTWRSMTGDDPVQLACVGSTPIPVLHHLADDPEFTGKLVIDVTEGLFFSLNPRNSDRPSTAIKYYDEITPAQRAGFFLNKPMESTFVFLDKEDLSLNALLDQLEIPSRPGVMMMPIFPRDFDRVKFDRQEYMGPLFLADTNKVNKQRSIWAFFGSINKTPPLIGPPLDSLMQAIKISIDKIKARGGQVIFVRTPSSGPMLEKEMAGFPREQYWDKLLSVTQCQGIHFQDDPETNTYICPEFSHLTIPDAIDYTKHLIRALKEKGWTFPNSTSM